MNTREEWFNRLKILWRRFYRTANLWWLEIKRFVQTLPWNRVRPGWYLLAGLVIYAVFATLQWQAVSAQLNVATSKLEVFEQAAALENAKLSLPIADANLPQNPDNLPNAPRAYRRGVSQGFVFTGTDAGVQIQYGMPVRAAADGKLKFLSANYKELTTQEFLALLEKVKDGASQNDLAQLRGRQVVLLHENGTVTRYGHLSSLNSNLSYAKPIKRGDVLGFVGNSGTLDGARGNQNNARLLFEVWLEGETKFLGAGLKPNQIRLEAAKFIKLP